MAVVPQIALADLQQARAIVDAEGRPTPEFMRILNGNTRNTRQVLIALAQVVTDQQAQLDLIKKTQRRDAISASYTAPSTTLSASDAGTSATITVAAHTRFFGDETSLAVSGASITGLAYSMPHAVYYDDPERDDTAPVYVATTNLKIAQANYAPGRIFVGNIITPAAGSTTSTTGGTGGSGGSFETQYEIEP